MEKQLYLAILIYFLLGAVAFAFISQKRDKKNRRKIWTKYTTYLLIIHILFASIYLENRLYTYLGMLILMAGAYELIRTHCLHGKARSWIFPSVAMLIYSVFAAGFILHTTQEKEMLYFAFFVVTVFDAFSQISGQILGGPRLWPAISPGKTISGLAGGSMLACLTAIAFAGIIGKPPLYALFFASIIVIFALSGDLLASFYKRYHGVKDFSHIIPGHGGFLDRFDSLIPGGAALYVLNSLL